MAHIRPSAYDVPFLNIGGSENTIGLRIRAGTKKRRKWQAPPLAKLLREGPKNSHRPLSVPTPYGIQLPGVSLDSIQILSLGAVDQECNNCASR